MSDRDETQSRRHKLETLREGGFNYPNDFKPSHRVHELINQYGELSKSDLEEKAVPVTVAGRVILRRVMGKATFATVLDEDDKIQIYLRKNDVGEETYDVFEKLSDLGDIIGVVGRLMKTNRGELTVEVDSLKVLAKSLQPLPEKFHGLSDQEFKYRRRYVDLIVNEESRQTFTLRSQVLRSIRQFFHDRDYLEVETPMLHSIPGGALAKPFKTHHNALSRDLYLRIAPELFLKRLVVGGFPRVFEINRNFRNEGLSTKHSPEFTMLEFYEAYSTFEDLIPMTQDLLRQVVFDATGGYRITYDGIELDFEQPAKRVSMQQAVADKIQVDEDSLSSEEQLSQIAKDHDIENTDKLDRGELLNELFETHVESDLKQPTFVTDYPASISPLAMKNSENPVFTDRFELFIAGREIANGFSELNDPDDQRQRFLRQVANREKGDEEAMAFDEDYLTALEFGMPPTAGEGIGIDRLVMLLTDSPTIRDVVLFPQLRQRD